MLDSFAIASKYNYMQTVLVLILIILIIFRKQYICYEMLVVIQLLLVACIQQTLQQEDDVVLHDIKMMKDEDPSIANIADDTTSAFDRISIVNEEEAGLLRKLPFF